MKKIDEMDKSFSINGRQGSRGWVWDDTRVFLAVARLGTLSAASRELKLGIATLSRRIERLEQALGIPLFVRQQTGYQLTEEGEDLLDKAEGLESAALAFASEVSAQAQISGKVRLATAENLATELILPALPAFYQRYPELSIELMTDSTTVNLHRRDADLALRMLKPERGNVTLRRLGVLGYGLYSSAEYASQRIEEIRPLSASGVMDSWASQSFFRDSFITWSDHYSHLPASQWIETALQGREPALRTTSLRTQVVAAQAGLGIALLPHFIGREADLRCLSAVTAIDQDIYLVMQTDLAHSRRVRAVADFLVELVNDNATRLSGEYWH